MMANLTKIFNINKWRFGSVGMKEGELTRYLKPPLLILEGEEANNGFDPLKWWRGNLKEYLTLAYIAFEVYSIPAMSVEP